MHRNQLLDQLRTYQQLWPHEGDVVRRFVDFIEAHEDCFERHLEPGHVTGSAWLINKAGTHVLLTHHRKLNKWFQLGGHADGDSNIPRVAMREVQEESGLEQVEMVNEHIFDIDAHLIPARAQEPEHIHYDIRYAFQVTGSEAYTVSHESHDLQWVALDAMAERTTEASMLRMTAKQMFGKATIPSD